MKVENMGSLVALCLVMLAIMAHGKRMSQQLNDLSSSIIPEEYPDGDLSLHAHPIFTQEPEDAYAAKGKPAEIVCKVAHAKKVFFVCNDETKLSTTIVKGLKDANSKVDDITKITLKIERSEINSGIGDYMCKCKALSAKGIRESKEVHVSSAKLRRDFVQAPYSNEIELGRQHELRCIPPESNPPAHVKHWLKDGKPIDASTDSNFHHSSTGKGR